MTDEPPNKNDERFPDPSKFFRIAWFLLSGLPNHRGSRFRVPLLRRAGATVGERVGIGPGVRVFAPAGLTIGDDVNISRLACIDARAGLTIDDGAVIGFESVLLTWGHRFDNVDLPVTQQGFEAKPIAIGKRAWIGARAFLLPGVTVGDGTIVGTGSIVTKSIGANVVAGGSPARVIRER